MTQVHPKPDQLDPTGYETLEIISRATAFNRWMYDTIRPFLSGEILEIGSGIGNISEFLIRDGYSIALSDYNPAYCHMLRKKYASTPNVSNIFTIDLQHPDFYTVYRALQQKFDTIFLLNVIEHLADDQKAVEYCSFLLRPGGRLVMLAPAYPFLYSRLDKELGHFRRYRKKDFSRLLTERRFRVVHRQYFNVLGMLGWFLFGRLGGEKQLTAGKFSLFNKLVPLARWLDQLLLKKTGVSVVAAGEKQ